MSRDASDTGGLPAGEADTFQATEADIPAAGEADAWQARTDRAWRARIEQLRGYAEEDGESVDAESERDLWRFVHSEPFIRKGNLVLNHGGKLHAVWKDGQGTSLAVDFEGGGRVRYVLFKQRGPDDKDMATLAGSSNFEGVKRRIRAFELQPLFYA